MSRRALRADQTRTDSTHVTRAAYVEGVGGSTAEPVPGRGTTADILVLAAVWLIFVVPFVVAGRTIVPVDWHGVLPTGAYGYPEQRLPNFYTLDPDGAIGADIGLNQYASDSLRHGIIPFWNPYQGLGQEFLAQGDSLVLYPLNWLHLLVPAKYWDLVKLLHLFLAACFFYLLAKECGLNRAHAIVCGCCAYAAGFFQGYLAMNTFADGFVWTPLVLVAVERVFRTGSFRPALWPGAIGTFCLATGCHPGLALALAFTLVVYVIGRCVVAKNVTAIAKIAVPIGIGLLCAAPSWMPFLWNAYQAREILGPIRAVLSLTELPATLLPHLYAPMQRAGIFGDLAGSNGQYSRFGWIVPAMTYYGMAGIIFAVREKNGRMLVFAGITIWLWLSITAQRFNPLAYVPLLSRATPYYVMGAIQILLCVLCAYGVAMLGRMERRCWLWINLAWSALLVCLLAIIAWVYHGLPDPDPNLVWKTAAPAVAWALAVPLLTWWGRRCGTVSLVATFALIANGIAYFPSGGDTDATVWLQVWPLLAVVAVSIAIGVLSLQPAACWAAGIATLLAVNVACVAHYRAWPKRYDPFTPAPFVNYLVNHGREWRSYATDSYLFPDLSSGFRLSTVNMLQALPPPTACDYFRRFLDPYQLPWAFYGIGSPAHGHEGAPMHTLLKHKRYWDYISARYLVTDILNRPHEQPALDARLETPMQSLTAVALDHAIEFAITPTAPVKRIDLLVSTYARKNPGRLVFQLADAKGAVVIADSRDSAGLNDNDYVHYVMPGAALLQPGPYLATVKFEPGQPGAMLAVWRDTVGNANYQYSLSTPQPLLTLVFKDKANALVWRNEAAQPILYVAPEAGRVANWHQGQDAFGSASDLRRTAFLETSGDPICPSDPGFPSGTAAADVSNIRVEPNRVLAEVDANAGGTLALVMSYAPGWSARINGTHAKVYRMNGAFQGACLAGPGKYQVEFGFEPPLWRVGLACAAVGFLLLIFLSKRPSFATA